MAQINWEDVWNSALKDKAIFPLKKIDNKTISVSCPTRFSSVGKFSIEITPSFYDNELSLDLLLFNDNVSIEDLGKAELKLDDFNNISKSLVNWELSNKLLDHFTISSSDFKDDPAAVDILVDYINNKATESGRMFDDKLDDLNDSLKNSTKESYIRILNNIRESRRNIFRTIESILKRNYRWKMPKNEDTSDSVTSFYDTAGNLAAVVSLVGNELIVDLSKNITSKISLLQSDEDIEAEIVSDINAAEEIKADQEIEHLQDIVANNDASFEDTYEDPEYLECLSHRLTKLENLYIKRKLRKVY